MAAQVALKRDEEDVVGYVEPSPCLVYRTSSNDLSNSGRPVNDQEGNNNHTYGYRSNTTSESLLEEKDVARVNGEGRTF
jgi:hypothetical protein